jgi:tRNA-specific adenosine deaminase 2
MSAETAKEGAVDASNTGLPAASAVPVATAAAAGSSSASASSAASAAPSTDDANAAEVHLHWMRLALEEAEGALREEEVPVGCIIVHSSSQRLLARGRNQTNRSKNGTRHCEFVALEQLRDAKGEDGTPLRLKECTLYVTVEPCLMCAAALRIAGIGLVVFGCGNERFGGCGSVLNLSDSPPLLEEADVAGVPAVTIAAPPAAASAASVAAGPAPPAKSLPPLQGVPFPCVRGVLAANAVEILKRFYARGNQNIPLERRHRKGVAAAAAATAAAATAAKAATLSEEAAAAPGAPSADVAAAASAAAPSSESPPAAQQPPSKKSKH